MKMNWGKMMMMIILMRKRIIECALSYPEVDPPITTFLIFVAHDDRPPKHTVCTLHRFVIVK